MRKTADLRGQRQRPWPVGPGSRRATPFPSGQWLFGIGMLAAAIMLPVCAMAEVSAELSAKSAAPGQAVTLILSQTGSAASTPDLTPLQQDFRIVDRSTIENVQIINGRRHEQRQLRLTLLPRSTGMLTVPPIQIGDETTPALLLTVAPAAAAESRLLDVPGGVVAADATRPAPPTPASITVTTRIEPKRVYVRQQVLLIVEVTSAEGPPTGRLRPPELDDGRVLPLGEERRIDAGPDGNRHVYEQRFALWPGKTGSIEIPPLQFDAWRPSGGDPVPVRSPPLQLEVAPIPESIDKQHWLPARALSLTEAGPSAVRQAPGQSLERMITLRADGLMAEDLPAIPLAIPFQLRIREDPPRLWNERNPDGVVGYRSERILIGSADAGSFLMRGPVIDWWDTTRGMPAQASLPDWTLTVAPYQSADQRPAATWGRQSTPEPPADTAAEAAQPKPPAGATRWLQAWPWLLGAAILLATAILLLRVRRQRRLAADSGKPTQAAQKTTAAGPEDSAEQDDGEATMEAAIDTVERAYRSGNAGAARQALLDWAALVWPERTPANLAQLAIRVDEPLRADIILLEKAFFSPTPLNWMRADVRDKLTGVSR